ncbi:GGDEF domain-containing protein [Kordiimonas lipolytica]|uniref:diguanylate cyclase n=1 Tax=Kordiimonas lipolytica TaxID=1662421 RepID=A0ABV8UDL7_9PROT|nr:GGDEF domain-containing protein [Kordiimonas lipolytica]
MHYRQVLSNRTARRLIIWRTLQGMIMGSGAPLGWACIQLLRGINLRTDISENLPLYLYMLFGTMLVFAVFGSYVGKQESLMQQRSLRDTLTGLYNLRHFRDRLDAEIIDARRQGTPLSLVFFDLDHFKRVNDTYGHGAGDMVLLAVAECVSGVLRRNELLARVGGEEFAVLLPHTSLEQATQLAERLREVMHELTVTVDGTTELSVTMSLGVVTLATDEGAKSFAERADAAMYEAKRLGRDRVFTA